MDERVKMRRVGDITGSGGDLPGEQVKVSELVDTEFVITRIDERTGDWGEYLAVVVEVEGKPFFFFSSHQVLVQKLRRCADDLPLLATGRTSTSGRWGGVLCLVHVESTWCAAPGRRITRFAGRRCTWRASGSPWRASTPSTGRGC